MSDTRPNDAANSGAKNQNDAMAAELVGWILKVVAMIFVVVSGYLLAAAYRDRPQGRWARVALVFLLLVATTYLLFGTPASLATLHQHRRDLHFVPDPLQLFEMRWHGLIAESFWDRVVASVGRSKTTPWAFYDTLKVLAYLAVFAVPFTGMLIGTASPAWTPSGPYRLGRFFFVKGVTPVTWIPMEFAARRRWWAAWSSLALQLVIMLAATAWLAGWDSRGLAFPLVAYFFTVGSLYTFYLFTVGRSWRTEAQIKAASRDRFTFGRDEDSGSRVGLTVEQLEYHVHLVGASGGGKSTLLWHVKAHHIRSGLGLIFVDLKADVDITSRVTALCAETGRLGDLKILDLSRPELTLSYNPCRRGNATEIKDKIVGAFTWESDYYKNCAQSHLLALLRGFVFLRDHKRLSFTLQDLLETTTSADAVVALELALNEAGAPTAVREAVNARAVYLRSRENQKELSGLRTQLELLLHSEFGLALTSDLPGVDFFDAIRNHEIVYVLLNSQTYGETAVVLGKLILQDLKSCSGEIAARLPERDRTHCTVVVDEFADLATEPFVGFLSRARGSKLGVVIAHQELADLDRAGKHFRDQVVTNTSTTISFLQKSAGSAEAIAGLAGTQTVTKATKQVTETNFFIWKDKQYTGVESEREVEEFKIHPNTIKSLKQGHCVAIGKFPSAWHARVAVDRPDYPEVDPAQVLIWLAEAKAAAEKQPSGFVALGLKERARALIDSSRKRSDGGTAAPGLRVDAPTAEVAARADAEGDDRF